MKWKIFGCTEMPNVKINSENRFTSILKKILFLLGLFFKNP